MSPRGAGGPQRASGPASWTSRFRLARTDCRWRSGSRPSWCGMTTRTGAEDLFPRDRHFVVDVDEKRWAHPESLVEFLRRLGAADEHRRALVHTLTDVTEGALVSSPMPSSKAWESKHAQPGRPQADRDEPTVRARDWLPRAGGCAWSRPLRFASQRLGIGSTRPPARYGGMPTRAVPPMLIPANAARVFRPLRCSRP